MDFPNMDDKSKGKDVVATESRAEAEAVVETDCTPVQSDDETEQQVDATAAEDQPLTTAPQLPWLRRHFTLEPPVTLFYFATTLSTAVFQNQLLYQTCTVVFHYNESVCQPMLGIKTDNGSSQQIESQIQIYVSRILMTDSLIQSIVPAVLSLFIGPWSDKFGRRPVMIAALVGYILQYIISGILAVVSIKSAISPWLYIIALVPSALSGGTCAFLIVVYSYIADVAPEHLRPLRMVLNMAAVGTGTIIGNLVSSYLFAATNMATVFATSAIAMALALAYICLVNEESVQVQVCAVMTKLREFFHYHLFVELVRACIAKRAQFQRAFIWLTMIALIITNFTTQGESNVFYLFVRRKFGITLSQYTTYNGIGSGIQIIGGIVGTVVFRKMLKMSVVTVSMITLVSSILESIVRAAAQQFWQLYLGTALGLLAGITSAMLLTIITIVAPLADIGKILAVTTALQTISPLVAAPLYTGVYNASLNSYPGLFNIISVSLYLVCFICVSTIFGIQRVKDIALNPPAKPTV